MAAVEAVRNLRRPLLMLSSAIRLSVLLWSRRPIARRGRMARFDKRG